MDYVWIALALAAMGGMWWVAYRMEPHWSSKDGRRFLCNAQQLSEDASTTRARETRVIVTPDGALLVTQKRHMRRHNSLWTLEGKAPSPPKRLQVYIAQQRADGQAVPVRLALRLPAKSRCVAVLDDVLAGQLTASPRAQGTAAPAAPPDPD